jgi:LysM repeat protein
VHITPEINLHREALKLRRKGRGAEGSLASAAIAAAGSEEEVTGGAAAAGDETATQSSGIAPPSDTVPPSGGTVVTAVSSPEAVNWIEMLPKDDWKIYIVMAGDTLGRISEDVLGSSDGVQDLLRWNGITDSSQLEVGQRVRYQTVVPSVEFDMDRLKNELRQQLDSLRSAES